MPIYWDLRPPEPRELKRVIRYLDTDGHLVEMSVGPEAGLTDDEWRARGCPVGLRYREEVAELFRRR